jgi:hypothetical protein
MAMFFYQWPADLCCNIFIYASSQIIFSLKLSNHGLNDVLSLHFPERTEENHAIFQSGLPVSLLRFEPNSSRVQAKNVAVIL